METAIRFPSYTCLSAFRGMFWSALITPALTRLFNRNTCTPAHYYLVQAEQCLIYRYRSRAWIQVCIKHQNGEIWFQWLSLYHACWCQMDWCVDFFRVDTELCRKKQNILWVQFWGRNALFMRELAETGFEQTRRLRWLKISTHYNQGELKSIKDTELWYYAKCCCLIDDWLIGSMA